MRGFQYMSKKLIITKINNHIVSSVYEDQKMTEVNISDNNSISLHDIYIGRVENIVKNINCAFIEITKGVKCYYSIDDNSSHIFLNRKNSDKVNIGDLMLVQISKEGIKTKLPSISCDINLPGKYVVLVKNASGIMVSNKIKDKSRSSYIKELLKPLISDTEENFGYIVRTNAETADEKSIYEEALKLKESFEHIMKIAPFRPAFTQVYSSEPSYFEDIRNVRTDELEAVITDDSELYEALKAHFETSYVDDLKKLKFYDDKLLQLAKLYNIEGSIRNAINKKVWLKSGGYLIIEPTEALTVIDVNTGKFSSNKKVKENTFLKINLEAAEEISRQLKLRNLSGIIIIDFINMQERENRQILWDYLDKIVSMDSVSTKLVDMTRLDLIELTRKKIRRPLHETCRELFSHDGGYNCSTDINKNNIDSDNMDSPNL